MPNQCSSFPWLFGLHVSDKSEQSTHRHTHTCRLPFCSCRAWWNKPIYIAPCDCYCLFTCEKENNNNKERRRKRKGNPVPGQSREQKKNFFSLFVSAAILLGSQQKKKGVTDERIRKTGLQDVFMCLSECVCTRLITPAWRFSCKVGQRWRRDGWVLAMRWGAALGPSAAAAAAGRRGGSAASSSPTAQTATAWR